MNPLARISQTTAAALALCLALPSPALALRLSEPQEDRERRSGLEEALRHKAGLEETPTALINQHLLRRPADTPLLIGGIQGLRNAFDQLTNDEKQAFTSAMLHSSESALDMALPQTEQRSDAIYYVTGPAGIDLIYSIEEASGQAEFSQRPLLLGIGVGLKAAAAAQFGLRAEFIGMSHGLEKELFEKWAGQIGQAHFIEGPTRTVVYLSPQQPTAEFQKTLVLNPSAKVTPDQAGQLTEHVSQTLPASPKDRPFVVWNVGHAFAGVSTDFDARLIHLLKDSYRVVTDFRPNVSRETMEAVFRAGPFMVKPNLGEVATYFNEDPVNFQDTAVLAQRVHTIARQHGISIFVVSLSERGALTVYRGSDGVSYRAVHVPGQELGGPLISEGGAGDSMVAAILAKLIQNRPVPEAVAYGVAAGTETVLLPGTAVATQEKADRRFKAMNESGLLFQDISLLGRPGVGPERRVVGFGGGRIGLGRLGPLWATQNGFDVIIVDPVEKLVAALNERNRYTVIPMGSGERIEVENVWGISSRDQEKIAEQGPWADWVFTSVRPENLHSLAPVLGKFIQKRLEAGRREPLNIVFAENLPVDQPQVGQLREEVLRGQGEEFQEYVRTQVGFVGAIVQGGVPGKSPDASDILSINVKPGPYALLLDQDAIRGPPPNFQGGIRVVPQVRARREKKLLVHNMPQVVLGYLAAIKEIKESRDAVPSIDVFTVIALAAGEAAEGLAAKYPGVFTRKELFDYAHEFLLEYSDPDFSMGTDLLARDPVRKLAANERLFAAAQNALDAGIAPDAITLGIASGLRYAATHPEAVGAEPDALSHLQRDVSQRAQQMGLVLPEDTEGGFHAAWRRLVGQVGEPRLTVSKPDKRHPLVDYEALVHQEVGATLQGRREKERGIYWTAVTGPVAAGKTLFLNALESRLQEAGAHVVHLTEDELGVMDRATRSRWETEGDPRWNDWRNWIRWDKILQDIAEINAAAATAEQTGQPQQVTLRNLYNRANNGTTDGSRTMEIRADTLIVYDGLLLTEKYPRGTFDRIVLFDIGQQEMLRRSFLRDIGFGRDAKTIHRYHQTIYLPLWISYVESFHPEKDADAVYDLTDLDHPVQLIYPAAGLEELDFLPGLSAPVPGGFGVVAAGVGDARGLPIGVALHRAGVPAAFVAESPAQAAGLEALGVPADAVFVMGPELGFEAAVLAAKSWLGWFRGAEEIVELGVRARIPWTLAQLFGSLRGVLLPAEVLSRLQGWIDRAAELLHAA